MEWEDVSFQADTGWWAVELGGGGKVKQHENIGDGAEGFFMDLFLQLLQWRGGVAQRKHSNGNQHNLVLNFSFV